MAELGLEVLDGSSPLIRDSLVLVEAEVTQTITLEERREQDHLYNKGAHDYVLGNRETKAAQFFMRQDQILRGIIPDGDPV